MTTSTKPPDAHPNPPLPSKKKGDAPITRREENRVTRHLRAVSARQYDEQTLGFCAREFVLCCLPYKRQGDLEYERRNGDFLLRVEGSRRFGLPFGQDRLIPIWLASAFQAMGKPQDDTIRFRCASDILRAFDITPGGKQLKELRGRIERIFGANYYSHDLRRKKKGMLDEGYRLIRRVDLWFERDENVNQYTLWQNEITLSADFANELREASIPIDLETVRALKENPAALDLYVWQAWRSFRLMESRSPKPLLIPVFGPEGLLAQLGSQVSESFKARQLLRRWQEKVRHEWRDCPNELSEDGSALIIRPARALSQNAKIDLPGVVKNPPPMRKTPTGNRLLLVSDE